MLKDSYAFMHSRSQVGHAPPRMNLWYDQLLLHAHLSLYCLHVIQCCLGSEQKLAWERLVGGRSALVVISSRVVVVQEGHPLLSRQSQGICYPHPLPAHLHVMNEAHVWSTVLPSKIA